jgi:hypothetical protein
MIRFPTTSSEEGEVAGADRSEVSWHGCAASGRAHGRATRLRSHRLRGWRRRPRLVRTAECRAADALNSRADEVRGSGAVHLAVAAALVHPPHPVHRRSPCTEPHTDDEAELDAPAHAVGDKPASADRDAADLRLRADPDADADSGADAAPAHLHVGRGPRSVFLTFAVVVAARTAGRSESRRAPRSGTARPASQKGLGGAAGWCGRRVEVAGSRAGAERAQHREPSRPPGRLDRVAAAGRSTRDRPALRRSVGSQGPVGQPRPAAGRRDRHQVRDGCLRVDGLPGRPGEPRCGTAGSATARGSSPRVPAAPGFLARRHACRGGQTSGTTSAAGATT